ncbi:MAG: zinc transporter ZupT [Oscillospiraceae bacterium]
MEQGTILNAFLITLFAGLATGIGSLIGLFAKRTNTKFLSASLGFAAGVMIYVSMIEIMPHAKGLMLDSMSEHNAGFIMTFGFVFGMIIMFFADKFLPQEHHCTVGKHSISEQDNLYRMGKITALALAVHNFPEGIATFTTSMTNTSAGLAAAFAIALHNIPEGISVSVPIYYATGDRKKAFRLSFLSGLVEPLGAVIGFLFLAPILNNVVMGSVLAIVAGIMVYISITELMPTATGYGNNDYALIGLILGMGIMGLSLVLSGHHH